MLELQKGFCTEGRKLDSGNLDLLSWTPAYLFMPASLIISFQQRSSSTNLLDLHSISHGCNQFCILVFNLTIQLCKENFKNYTPYVLSYWHIFFIHIILLKMTSSYINNLVLCSFSFFLSVRLSICFLFIYTSVHLFVCYLAPMDGLSLFFYYRVPCCYGTCLFQTTEKHA